MRKQTKKPPVCLPSAFAFIFKLWGPYYIYCWHYYYYQWLIWLHFFCLDERLSPCHKPSLNCQMNVTFFFYAVYSVLLSIVACLWVFTLKQTIPLFYCPSQVVFHSINYSIIVFSSMPLIIFLQFQDSISSPACHPVPLTKIFRSIILILRRICLNFQQ